MEAFGHLVLPDTELNVGPRGMERRKTSLEFPSHRRHAIDNFIFHMQMLVEGSGYILFPPKITHTYEQVACQKNVLWSLRCHLL